MTRTALALVALLAGASSASAQAPAPGAAPIAPIASWEVTTRVRTLRGCPLKRVITTAEGWARVTADLEGAPPAPALDGKVVLLVVADVTGGATSWLDPQLTLQRDGSLRARLWRQEPERGVDAGSDPALKASFVLLPAFAGGVTLEHRTILEGGGGFIELPIPADAIADRDPARLPELGPDLLFTYALENGQPGPPLVQLRMESHFRRQDLPSRLRTLDLPAAGLATSFPRFGRDPVQHTLAGHSDRLRSNNPLVLEALPPDGPDGSPRRIVHHFLLAPYERPSR